MPTTAFPAGVSSFGAPVSAGGLYDMPSGEVLFVCNRSGVFGGNGLSRDQPLTSIADAVVQIATTNPSKGAIIFVMAGHAENVTGSNIYGSSLVNTTAVTIPAGTRIIGEGFGGNRPTLTLTAAASTILLSTAGCSIENMIILCPQTGTTTVAAMVTVTGASCMVRNCQFQGSSSATALVTTGISVGTAAADLFVIDNNGYTVTGTPTSWMSSASTAAPSRITIQRNDINWLLTATTSGVIDMTGASVSGPTNMLIQDNTLANLTAASTVAAKFSATTSGDMTNNYLTILAAGAITAITTPGLLTMYGNLLAQQGKQGVATTVGGAST
jgi:hypothetical protein